MNFCPIGVFSTKMFVLKLKMDVLSMYRLMIRRALTSIWTVMKAHDISASLLSA